jgi:hypothetical protein
MIHGDNILNNQQDIVDAFADHFSSVFNRDRIHDVCDNSCSINNNTPCDFCNRKAVYLNAIVNFVIIIWSSTHLQSTTVTSSKL